MILLCITWFKGKSRFLLLKKLRIILVFEFVLTLAVESIWLHSRGFSLHLSIRFELVIFSVLETQLLQIAFGFHSMFVHEQLFFVDGLFHCKAVDSIWASQCLHSCRQHLGFTVFTQLQKAQGFTAEVSFKYVEFFEFFQYC